MQPVTDELFMSLAIGLAERGRGRTSPNPVVGAVVVQRDGVVVGRGAHEFAGGPHAEIHALREAGDRARGATLYCTLEPCCHTGRTGPCAPEVVKAGIARVVVAMPDPNPLVAGGGIRMLEAAGIDVTIGVLAEQAEAQNRPFVTLMRRRRPLVTMKVAMSADRRVASGPGVRTPLTGKEANRVVHRERAEVDAIAVGSGTVLADDPRLTARLVYRERPLLRVVFDRRLRTPASAALFSTLEAGPVIIVSTPSAAATVEDRRRVLESAGARVELVDDEDPIGGLLTCLGAVGVTSLVVEGGPTLHRAFWDADVVDRIELFVTPQTLGREGLPWLPLERLASATLTGVTARPLGADIMIEAYVHRVD